VSNSSGGSRASYKDQVTVDGMYGSRTVRRDDQPDIGAGSIEFVAVFDGVVDYRDDAIMGPVAVGEMLADDFRDDVGDRVDDIKFVTFRED